MKRAHDWSTFRNPAHRLVVTAVRTAEQLTKAADRFLKPFRLTIAQFNLLAVLMQEPGGMAQSRIGERLVVSRANVTVLVRRLKSRGLVTIAPEPTDSRVRKVTITAPGVRLLEKIQEPYFAEIDRTARGLKAADMDAASATLTRLGEGG